MRNWYQTYKYSMALEPGAWRNEETPARLQEDQNVKWTPYGKVVQKHNIDDLQEKYDGIHLTDSILLASVYANYKSSKNDPPVIVSIYANTLTKQIDVDGERKKSEIQEYINYNKNSWTELLDDMDSLMEELQNDCDFDNNDTDSTDMRDILQSQETQSIPCSIVSDMETLTFQEQQNYIQRLIDGNISDTLIIKHVNQYRVKETINLNQIHQISTCDRFSTDMNHDFENMTRQELKNNGIKKINGQFVNENGEKILSIEDLNYDFLNLKTIYSNPQSQKESLTYHGTSLSRIKKAFPELNSYFSGKS